MIYTETLKLRDQPTPEWIAAIRARYPVEKAIDNVLTRKLHNRNQSAAHKTDFDHLESRLISYLKNTTEQNDLLLTDLQRLTGGASKEQFTFNLTWNQNSGQRQTRKLMLRMDPAESVVETHRLREAQVLRAMWGEVPVPEVFWVEHSDEYLGHPFLIAAFVVGTVQPEGGGKVTGLGMSFEPTLRETLRDQFVRHLATIHTVDWRSKDLSAFDAPEAGTKQANEWSLGAWERIWQEDTMEAHPIMEQAAIWLKANMPVVDNPVIQHGDYRSGNFMYDHSQGDSKAKINAILDWELCHIGDFHEDIAYNRCKMLGTPDGKGGFRCSGLLYFDDFVEKYQTYSGYTVDMQRLKWYDIFTYYKMTSISCTSLRIAHAKKTHLDAMMNLIGGVGFLAASELARLLEKA